MDPIQHDTSSFPGKFALYVKLFAARGANIFDISSMIDAAARWAYYIRDSFCGHPHPHSGR
jgi:hypothetical protein